MKIQHLNEFYILSQYLNFTKAAEQLYITQPALSKHITAMEEELGAQLIERTTKEVKLTTAGKILRDALPQIIGNYDQVVERIREDKKSGKQSLRIGVPAVAVNDYFGRVPEIFAAQYPSVRLSFHPGQPEKNLAELFADELDIVMVAHIPFPNSTSLTFYDYAVEPLVVICKDGTELSRKSAVTFQDLKGCTFIGVDSSYYAAIWEQIELKCRWTGFSPAPVNYPTLTDALIAARLGKGILVVGQQHRSLAMQGLTHVLLDEPSCIRKISLAYKSFHSSPLIPQFIDVFRQYGYHLSAADIQALVNNETE